MKLGAHFEVPAPLFSVHRRFEFEIYKARTHQLLTCKPSKNYFDFHQISKKDLFIFINYLKLSIIFIFKYI